MTTTTTPRVRITPRIRREASNLETRIALIFRECARAGSPLQDAQAMARAARTERSWPASIANELWQRADAISQYLVNSEAKWVLTVDGIPTDSTEISARRAAGDELIWERCHGRHEWRSHPGQGFYTGEAPQYMGPKRD